MPLGDILTSRGSLMTHTLVAGGSRRRKLLWLRAVRVSTHPLTLDCRAELQVVDMGGELPG